MLDSGDKMHGRDGVSGNMLDGRNKVHARDRSEIIADRGAEVRCGDEVSEDMVEEGNEVHGDGVSGNLVDDGDKVHGPDGGEVNSPTMDTVEIDEDAIFEPCTGMIFGTNEEAYSFYQEYAKSTGFSTTIKNSRRSRASREFIDAKFACSRYRSKRDSIKAINRRPCVKTFCEASMHVKRRKDGKWLIHSFIKEHNHELLPAQDYYFQRHRSINPIGKSNIDTPHVVGVQTKKIYVEMSRQTDGSQNVGMLTNDIGNQFDKGRHLVFDAGDAQVMLEHFIHMQNENSNFFYAVDVSEEQRLRNVFWVDAKSRCDYVNFGDVVSFDTTYVKNKYKMPFALFVGVNHHFQFVLLGCALIADETTSTFVWLMQTWLRAMGGRAPRVILTDQDKAMKVAVAEVFPDVRHCFSLWYILRKIPENLCQVTRRHEDFMAKFNKCIYRSWTDEQFEKKWQKMVDRFELEENEWIRSLYEDREQWVPTYMRNTFFAGMSTIQRSDSINSFFDKYVHRKTTLKEFVEQYEAILRDIYEEEGKADFDTWHKQPALRSPSPFEKQMSTLYTPAVFKKFQFEVLGAVACHPKIEKEDDTTITFRVQDFEESQDFIVAWDETKSEVSCLCRSFEYKGFLCRHALIVLQISGLSDIPSQYILKRWTKNAKSRHTIRYRLESVQSRVERYNDICQRAIKLGEEGSLSQESYNIAFRALAEGLNQCVTMKNNVQSVAEPSMLATHDLHNVGGDNQGNNMIKNSEKNSTSNKKVHWEPEVIALATQDTMQPMGHLHSRAPTINGSFVTQQSLQGMEQISSRALTFDGYYGTQHSVQGMVLNLMGPTYDGYYGNQQSMQRRGSLNSTAPDHDGYNGTQHSMHGLDGTQHGMHGLGRMDFRSPTSGSCYGMQGSLQDMEESNLRSTRLNGEASKRLHERHLSHQLE
ncbi:hypothetical protein HHK36_004664 [Tetracentron sinense]|uniref:Protein FAR1-RELATED SEQUENCE n=1 Tax=Tetracentron sinense TaxID=13715 RepID=A0A835DM29_TETSI|nr:hypothetical protein HHK36_004664 [Tetracentron sinense]